MLAESSADIVRYSCGVFFLLLWLFFLPLVVVDGDDVACFGVVFRVLLLIVVPFC